jgi:hypothetical protein
MKKFPLLLGLFVVSTALAQSAPPPDGPVEPRQPSAHPEEIRYEQAPGRGFLERRFGLSHREAQRRLALENQVPYAVARLQKRYSEAFLASIIDHTPVFQVTFVLSRDIAPDEVGRAIPADLQSVFKVKKSRYSARKIRTRENQIVQALVAAKIAGSVGYDYRTDKFEVTSTEEGGQKLLASLQPDLRSDVHFVRGGIPTPIQSGAMAGDSIYGGWMVHQFTSAGATAICTYGFAVKTPDAQNGIVTASTGHCAGPIGIHYDDGHDVTLPTPPAIDKRILNTGGSRCYDYSVYYTGTLTTGPYVWFWNQKSGDYYKYVYPNWEYHTWANVNPDYPLDGAYTRVTGVIAGTSGTSNANHPQGATRCKGGFVTGITCGQVTLSEAAAVNIGPDGSAESFYGYVKLEGTDYMVFSFGGDSGGPVMTLPVWNSAAQYYDAAAAGIIEVGSTKDRGDKYRRPCITPDDGSCPMYYMPIDRVNDHLPFLILTTSGAVSPN